MKAFLEEYGFGDVGGHAAWLVYVKEYFWRDAGRSGTW
jgi:hypothetical protein